MKPDIRPDIKKNRKYPACRISGTTLNFSQYKKMPKFSFFSTENNHILYLGGYHNAKTVVRYSKTKKRGGEGRPKEAIHYNVGYPDKCMVFLGFFNGRLFGYMILEALFSIIITTPTFFNILL